MTTHATVLVVDDCSLLALTLGEHLEQAGCRVIIAERGDDALAILRTQTVDAVVTDVCMPGLDGLTLLEESKKLDPARPVLVMTGCGYAPSAARAMRAGALAYLLKPVKGDEIVRRLNWALERLRWERTSAGCQSAGDEPTASRAAAAN
jgi:DNA-binding NtrC family response regulator